MAYLAILEWMVVWMQLAILQQQYYCLPPQHTQYHLIISASLQQLYLFKLDRYMHHSQYVTQFTINRTDKPTPSTVSPTTPSSSCPFCKDHLSKVTELRKRQIVLQLQNEEMKAQVQQLRRERDQLINQKVLTYHEYQQRVQSNDGWNREDLQAQLFEAKIIIQLLLTSKAMPNHPQIKELDCDSLRQKYSNLLLQHLKIQEKLMIKDRIIEEKVFFPIYHYDQRVATLRKAVSHWYHKAQEECTRMKRRCKDLKQNMQQQIENMRQVMNDQLQKYRVTLSLSHLNEPQKKKVGRQQRRQNKKQQKGRKQRQECTRVQSKKLR